MPRRLGWLAVAVALHAGVFWLLPAELPTTGLHPRAFVPVKIRVHTLALSPRPVDRPEKRRAPSSSKPPRKNPGGAGHGQGALGAKPSGNHKNPQSSDDYSALLPGKDWQPGPAKPHLGNGPISTKAHITADEILGKLDIPLIAREGHGNVKAMAKIMRVDASLAGFRFVSVDGDPLLRAVLFEALRDPANRRTVLDLFKHLDDGEVLISLRQRTVMTDLPLPRFDEGVTVDGNKVIVNRTLYVGPAASGGALAIVLPDAEAERAKARDRGHREALERSPAYISPIRNRDP